MGSLGNIAFSVVATLSFMIAIWLVMGKRHLGELTAVDFVVSVTAGTVAGAGIADSRIELGRVLVALALLALFQVALSWVSVKSRGMYKNLTSEPVVVVENGQIIKERLCKVRITVETVLQLLREKDVFDITEVELAVLEPNGRLSVLKKSEYLPIKPCQVNLTVAANRILFPVIIEKQIDEQTLRSLGFSDAQIGILKSQYNALEEVFVAFMDKEHQVHIVKDKPVYKGSIFR
ncbi:MAG: hypothetical protein H6Q75_1093 [Firmicutes bacterium]|nr:hypothetical protein [Bacillota bacterium]